MSFHAAAIRLLKRRPFLELQIEQVGAWQIASAKSFMPSGHWWAWAKMGPITGVCPMSEPGKHVWAQFADTRDEAIRLLKEELGL